VVKLSAFYLDVIKDRLYVNVSSSAGRRSAQTVLHLILSAMVRMIAPVLPFTAEEIWQKMPSEKGRQQSVHFASFPQVQEQWLDEALSARWERLMAVRDEVLKVLEILRKRKVIGNSLEAAVDLYAGSEDLRQLLNAYGPDLKTLFIVSRATLRPADDFEALERSTDEGLGLVVGVTKADGRKCELCWNYSPAVGEHQTHTTLCERCVRIVEQLQSAP
jgi:isoleucyl-tRNA synthetase